MMKRQLAIFTLLLISLASGCQQKSAPAPTRQLNVNNWTNYIGKMVVYDFQTENNLEVNYQTYTSNDELDVQLRSPRQDFDVIFPSDSVVQEMIKDKLLMPLDHTKLPNFVNIDPKFKNMPYDPSNKYCIPYIWGVTGLAVNSNRVEDDATSWDILWDEKLSKRISILKESRAAFVPALKRLGFSLNTENTEEIQQAKELLLKQKPLVYSYSSDTYIDFLETSKVFVAQGYSGDVLKLSKTMPNIKFIIPKEGADLWVDNVCIAAKSKNKAGAHAFINFLMKPEIAARTTNETGFATANLQAKKFIRPEILNNPSVFPSPEILDKCEYASELSDATEDLYEDLWVEVLKAPATM